MVTIELDGRKLRVPEGTTILEAAQSANIPIPHLCYLKDINEIAACRMCVVEVEGAERMVTACNNQVFEGMVVHTNTPAVRQARPAWSMGLTGPVDPGVPLEEPDRSPESRLPATHGAGPDSGRFGTAGRGDDCRGSCGTAPVRRDSASRSCRRSGQTDCRPGNGFRAP